MKDPKTLEKFDDEERIFAFDFSKQPEMSPTPDLTGTPSVTATPVTVPPLTIGTPQIDGAKVKAEFAGGLEGTVYLVKCLVDTSGGAKLEAYGRLSIVDTSGY